MSTSRGNIPIKNNSYSILQTRNYYGFKEGNAEDYLQFLKKMQNLFAKVNADGNRTLAKLIDEHNYITITMNALNQAKSNSAK